MTEQEGKELHLDETGRARMVDVSGKESSRRTARARARVRMHPATLDAVERGLVAKGDALAVAQVAGVMAVKKTPDLIPLCHPLAIDAVRISYDFEREPEAGILLITAEVTCTGRTGVEMEAMTAAAVTALAVYDMTKALDRWMSIESIELLEKTGGRSGHLRRP